jgi:ribonuclease HII
MVASGVVRAMLQTASVMARASSLFWAWVLPENISTWMIGMASLLLVCRCRNHSTGLVRIGVLDGRLSTVRRSCNQPLLSEELQSWRRGLRRVAGVDEAGRGPMAGPVVAAAVVLDPSDVVSWWAELRDSKLLSSRARERLSGAIRREAEVGVGVVGPDVIDDVGIMIATCRAMRQALEGLCPAPDQVLVDGLPLRHLAIPHRALVGGDRCCLSIAAASIVAKVERDRLMVQYESLFPGYGFAQHKGYPTADHARALAVQGPCAIHRRSWAPVRAILERLC